jgi:hypothetical protein
MVEAVEGLLETLVSPCNTEMAQTLAWHRRAQHPSHRRRRHRVEQTPLD